MRRILTLVCAAFFVIQSANCQIDLITPGLHRELFGVDLIKIFINEDWYNGKVLLDDNIELNGLVNYNPSTGLVRYKNEDETRSFAPKGIIMFTFYDSALKSNRLFYSLEYIEEASSLKKNHFFEVLKEYEDFALLYMVERANLSHKYINTSDVFSNSYNTKTLSTEQRLNLCIFTYYNLRIERIFVEDIENVEGNIFERERITSKYRFTGNKFFKDWMGNKFDEVEAYRTKNGIGRKSVEDLVKVVEFYVSIR
ncbi:MAG: hypothetical protein MUF68_04480 [Cyclobacteriaceae bacterium]|nr:hypothetical protein [Cyclobacteriaceae bacterium]